MRGYLLDLWIRIRSSYWFIPSLMSVCSIGLASLAVSADQYFGADWIDSFSWLYANDAQGARSLLATVAGSMITVAGVTFSMTLLMVSHASAQIGPRVVSGFMRDTGAQVVLGTFIATFLFCLMVLRSVVPGSEEGEDAVIVASVPQLAIIIAILLTLFSVAVLIYFVHHVPTRMSIPVVTNRIGRSILRQLNTEFPVKSDTDVSAAASIWQENPDAQVVDVCLDDEGGYLRIIDRDALVEIAVEHDSGIEVSLRPGQFCVRGATMARISNVNTNHEQAASVCDDVRACFSWGGDRTQDQDILFLVDQLTEIAGKALSPGVNDQFTAFGCIDQMERVLRELRDRPVPQVSTMDDSGILRLIEVRVTATNIADRFLRPMLQFSAGDSITSAHLVEMLGSILRGGNRQSALCRTLQSYLEKIQSTGVESLPTALQRKELAEVCERVSREIDAPKKDQ